MTITTQQIIDRLNAQRLVESGAVATVDQLQAAPAEIAGFTTSPMLFVDVPSEAAQASDAGTGTTRNPTDIRFRVFIVFTGGDFNNTAIETARDAIKAALIGWTPDSAVYDPVNPVSAAVMDQDMKVGYLRFLLVFSSHYTQRTP